ncbi:neurobeachin-like protein 1 isoform X1 [Drosophila miranda]|uniref:neurobeachin-like protein 1 isoform X1 n=1 Tax=Drosophila miranda TaxID=7229 RepID=UPI0007E6CB67|nr:neurobeachin-like protein 1 isoform X1 [Drosophila miranda]
MDNKKDIYNLWVQYTTKNDERYFREFVARFVAIWRSQLQLDFQAENCAFWHEVLPDSGPHLGRLPDELLPAIGKFIIVARDASDTSERLEEEAIEQVATLIECLVIVCRHFDNILAIITYEYKPNLIAILSKAFKQQMEQPHAVPAISHLFRSFSAFLEVMYDPYLTWRSFVRGQAADYTRLSYKPHSVHVEIVPFIYDCFQEEALVRHPDVGESLLNILGAVICGSQKSLSSTSTLTNRTNTNALTTPSSLTPCSGDGLLVNCDNLRNGMKAICPATVSITMGILRQWESGNSLRRVALNCYALMVIVLQKSSPEERQIDLVTLVQLYCDALQELLATKHFDSGDISFDIAIEEDQDVVIDMAALSDTVAAVKLFLTGGEDISESIGETNLLELLTNLPKIIMPWHIAHSSSLCSTMEALATLTRHSLPSANQLRQGERIEKLFASLREFSIGPSVALLETCFMLGYDESKHLLLMPEVMLQLLHWLPTLQEREQLRVTNMVLKGCTDNYGTKSVACDSRVIKAVCGCLLQSDSLAENCVQNLIKLIEELSKISIVPGELKCIFTLLRQGTKFPQSRQLQQTLVVIALQSLRSSNSCAQYVAIEQPSDGIVVPDIRNWTISGSYGFIFHILVRFSQAKDQSAGGSSRRMLLTLQTGSGSGFEVFVQPNGNVVVAALTRREYLTSSTATKTLMDGQWHYLTVAITPPKRPFSYSQINIYVDFVQKLSATLKVQAVNEPFTVCSIGAVVTPPQPGDVAKAGIMARSSSQESGSSGYKSMLPSLLERTLSANVSNYFTLPTMRTQTAFDPNVKNFPIGMQDTVFGEPTCLQGHLGGVLLADPTTSLRTIFDAGMNFSSIFSQDNDLLELNSRFVFCYAPAAVWHGTCQDLIPGGKYPGRISAQHCKIVKIQETINSIGGISAILPILHRLVSSDQTADISIATSEEESLSSPTPTAEELGTDWEMLSSNSYTEWKMIQHPLASFLCLLRYLTHEHETNQEQLLASECLAIIGTMLQRCPPALFDVNALMATHLLMESLQGHKSGTDAGGHLLDTLYAHIVFDFGIWSRLQFQITLGHAQYLSAMIKNDRKFYRRHYGVQFVLDVVRQYYSTPDNISNDDAKTIRATLFGIVRFYLQKEVNIKEVNAMVTFLASVRQDVVLVEFLEMITLYVRGKNCRDQMVLLLHEPQTANLIYNFFVDKSYTNEIQEAAIRFISGLLATSRVHQKYKQVLRLYDQSSEQSMFPGFFSFITPMSLSSTILFHLADEMLGLQPDYAGLIFLVYHVSSCDLPVKLEIAKRLLQTTFVKPNATSAMARQTGWQESIARLLIRKPLTSSAPDEEKRRSFGINMDVLLEDNSSFLAQADLITFSEQEIGLAQLQSQQQQQEEQSDSGLILNEIQASVSEAATVIESEIKELAESVSGAVVDNVNSVFSVLRQTTHDLQDTFESLTQGSSTDAMDGLQTPSIQREESLSSDSSTPSPHGPPKKSDSLESTSAFDFVADGDVDTEEQLVYLVSNTLFNIFWRGIANDHPQCWQERGQVLGCINLLALNNDLITSHLSLRLRILEMAVQASLFDLSEHGSQTLINQENASHILRMVYELVVLGSNEDESKKCSTKLLDGVLALLDALMIFQQGSSDDWSDMIRLCLGLLLKCSHHPNPGIVAMATAKLHAILQSRSTEDPAELSYLLYSINRALDNAIEVGNPEEYSFLMPVMKALLEKCRLAFNLDSTLPDLPSTSSGPVFFNDFQMYSTSKKWRNFIERMVKPLYDRYQRDIELHLWEPINRFWAECYEACKAASKQRATYQTDNRRLFQQKIYMPWKVRQVEEMQRLQAAALHHKTLDSHIRKRWKRAKRFLYGPRGPWYTGDVGEDFWKLSPHENVARMRLKLEPQLYPNKHENAANLRDNATSAYDAKEISEFDSSIKNAVVRDFLADDESSQLEEELRQLIDSQSQQDVALEKLVMSQDCELITLMTKVKGRIEVNQSVFTFVDLSPPTEDGSKHDFRFSTNKIREVHLRKYNLRRSALEIFLVDQTSYFLNFTTKTRNKVFTKIVGLPLPNILYGSGRSPAELLRASGLTQRWINREISNFEYLMYLNTIAGRSYNDLSQYPVFPWILADYSSDVLDLTDPKSFRDLSKPIGCINPKNEAEVRNKYDSFEDPSGAIPKFHYGTHYSNSAGVLHYLLRVEPFTSLHIELQSGRFDVADRQFHSIPQTWKLLMDNPNDVKELIPEFFYFPEFLKNMNKFDLGHLQITKEKVDDVILPAWATTPEEFIAIHRRALESEYVSQHLHHWIDLIFGYKQKGPKAAEALNVFYYCSYEGAVDLDKITNQVEREAVEGMINNFGQVPSQLLREPHPRRLTHDETAMKLVRAELRRPDLTQFLDKVVQYYCELSTPKDPIAYLSSPRSPPRSFLQLSPDVLVSVSKSTILGCNSWLSYDKDQGFLLEIDATTTNLKNRKRVFGPFHSSQPPHSQLFAVSTDGKLLYAGGIWDNALRVYNLNKGKTVASVTRHLDIITCIALDNCGSYLVTGSRDCTCIVWSIQQSNQQGGGGQSSSIPVHALTGQSHLQAITQVNTQNSYSPKPLTVLYGHDDAISSVAIYTELDLVVSGSLDGTINVYTLQEGQFVRTLKPIGCTESCVQISFVTLSYHGHIAFSALDDTSHSVHVYSINGSSLGSKYVSGRVTGLACASDYLVVADDAGDITMSRLHGLKPVFDIPLHVPIQTVVVTPGNTHILAPLRDGRLAVIAVQLPSGGNKKHSVLNV